MKTKTSLAGGVLALALFSAACGGAGEDSPTAAVDTTAAPVTTTAPAPAPAPAPASTTTTAAPERLSTSSRLRIDGIGPIHVGMTVAEARAVAGTELSLKKEPYCDVLTAPNGPAGVDLIITDPPTGRIDLVIVHGGRVATLSGIQVGSTEAEVVAAYPGRLRAVNPSLPVHRQVYQAQDPALGERALVFVIDGSRVASMYAGQRSHVEADEICA